MTEQRFSSATEQSSPSVRISSIDANVRLQGEAFFDVASDPIHPFVVQTPDLHIRVLGTAFDVITGDTTVAILERGCIALETTSGKELATMHPGQRAVVDGATGRLASLEQVQTGKYTSWRFNHKVYDGISFAEFVPAHRGATRRVDRLRPRSLRKYRLPPGDQ